ncbi:MAG: hypothetical protein MJZ37_08835 [Bacilli bacterium]|nr:hypothetical protein [Bacilli bacterium]
MAKISNIKTFVGTVLANAHIAEAFDEDLAINSTTGLVEKCMDQICLNQLYEDKLPELDGDEKEFGAYIEEYAMGLLVPRAATNLVDGQEYATPYIAPALQDAFCSWRLPEYIVAGSTSYSKYKSSMKSAEAYSAYVGNIVKQMVDSYNQMRFEEKKSLLGWAADNVGTTTTIAKPVDDLTGEAFIKQIKNAVEEASFARDVGNVTLGGAESFTLYLTKGIKSVLDVDTLAGAINEARLVLPCTVKVVDDLGTSSAYAMLVDNRAIKLFPNRNEVGTDVNAYHDFVTTSRHVIDTPFVSKYATIIKFVE